MDLVHLPTLTGMKLVFFVHVHEPRIGRPRAETSRLDGPPQAVDLQRLERELTEQLEAKARAEEPSEPTAWSGGGGNFGTGAPVVVKTLLGSRVGVFAALYALEKPILVGILGVQDFEAKQAPLQWACYFFLKRYLGCWWCERKPRGKPPFWESHPNGCGTQGRALGPLTWVPLIPCPKPELI